MDKKDKYDNEITVLIRFLEEFNPVCASQDLERWTYRELVNAVKETVKEM